MENRTRLPYRLAAMKACKNLLPILALVAAPSVAEDQEVTEYDRFRLWNNCQQVGLAIETIDEDAAAINLTVERVEVIVRSRLRAARLYTAADLGSLNSHLYVNINVGRTAYNLTLAYKKVVRDLATGMSTVASTWEVSGVGTHGNNGGFILSYLAEYTDKFIDEYLRVNEGACSPASRQ